MGPARAAVAALSLLGATCVRAQSAPAAPVPIAEALTSVRHDLKLGPSGLSGDGAPLLSRAVAESRLVAVGEDHLTREIPAFVSSLCDASATELAGLALEVGPTTLTVLRPILAGPGRLDRMAAFNAAYPSAVAFLDTRDDNAMAAHCLARRPGLKLIGLDQEFLGSAGLLLDRILAERLSPHARRQIARLRAIERQDARAAAATGEPARLFLLAADDKDWALGRTALAHGGTPRAVAIFSELEKSREIYRLGGNASNQLRARLLKANLRAQLPPTGKVILKMGDWHLYRGYNPLNNRDVGNWVAERADEEGRPSLHILILGVKGVHALYAGFARPLKLERFSMVEDRDYRWLQAAVDAAGGTPAWSLFDLRRLRDRRLADVGPEWRRVLDGFDLLILVPELTPSETIAPVR